MRSRGLQMAPTLAGQRRVPTSTHVHPTKYQRNSEGANHHDSAAYRVHDVMVACDRDGQQGHRRIQNTDYLQPTRTRLDEHDPEYQGPREMKAWHGRERVVILRGLPAGIKGGAKYGDSIDKLVGEHPRWREREQHEEEQRHCETRQEYVAIKVIPLPISDVENQSVDGQNGEETEYVYSVEKENDSVGRIQGHPLPGGFPMKADRLLKLQNTLCVFERNIGGI